MKTSLFGVLACGLLTLTASPIAFADDDATAQDIEHLKTLYADAEEIRPTPLPGVYEIERGSDISYVGASGEYGFSGADMMNLQTGENLTEARRSQARLALIDRFSNTIDFLPEDAEHSIYVFTDISCGWCQRLHSEMEAYHEQKIGVRYLAYPRLGPSAPAWRTMESVWCSDDPAQALTDAKSNKPVAREACDVTAVPAHYLFAQEMGIGGTPALLTEKGALIPGYVPAAELKTILTQ